MRSIVKSIYEHQLTQPKKIAIIAEDITVDYQMLWEMMSTVAALLKEKGLQKGDRVILEADHTVEFLVCCYGIHLAGAVHVPIEYDVPESRVQEIANEITPALILTGKHPLEHLNTSLDKLQGTKAVSSLEFPSEEMLQEILYTTGTTGKSKGVMITHCAQMNMCISQNAALNYSDDNVWLIPTPMNHAAGLRKTHMSMVKGSTVLLVRGFKNLKRFFELIHKHKVTSIYLPPAGVHYILTLASKKVAELNNQLDFIYSSSAALPGGDKEKLIELLPNVRKFDAYGGSEVGAVFYIDYNFIRGDSRCMGKPNHGAEVYIVDEDYNPIQATAENPGIIAIKSNTVTSGYWNEPELTKQTIINGTIYMSDLGYIDSEGNLYLVGRRDDVINVGGLKIAPTEVEDVAMRHESVNECVCVPCEDETFGICVKMYVKLNEGYVLDAGALSKHIEENLEKYKVPRYIETISEIPRTFNGKIDRKKLRNT